ncbi:MAG: hypothetical protein H6807_07320 [Planctomycetes bacterium]|nr:hypothetical protein [Planctomycetota bacterium]
MKHGTYKFLLVALLATACAATAMAQSVPDMHYLRFNEGTGNTTADLAIPGVGAAPTLPSGIWDPTNNYLGAAGLKILTTQVAGVVARMNQPFSVSGSWTIEIWARDRETTTATRYLFGDSSASIYAYRTSTGNLVMGGTGMTALTVTNALPNITWTHVAYVYDSAQGTLTCYLNGVQAGQNTQSTTLAFNGSNVNGLMIGGYSSTTLNWFGNLDEFRMWNSARSQAQIAANMNFELNTVADDLGIASLDSPVSTGASDCLPLSNAEAINFTLVSYGTNMLPAGTLFSVDLTIDGSLVATEIFGTTNNMNIGDTESFGFLATGDFSMIGSHSVSMTLTWPGDLNPSNDTLNTNVNSGSTSTPISTFPWTENFDSTTTNNTLIPPTGWVQDQTDASGTDSDWHFYMGQTGSFNTGPVGGDHTTGSAYYAYVEDSSGNYPQVNLQSPCIDLSAATLPRLSFWLHSWNYYQPLYENFISVDIISYPGGVVTTDVLGPIGHQQTAPGPIAGTAGNWALSQWTNQFVDLSPWAGSYIRIQFRGRSDGGSTNHDIAIDDVTIFDFVPGVGQPGQPGLAVLDINDAVNQALGGLGPNSGDPGPFATTGTAGGPLDFTLSGEPFAPILLMIGPLNPVAATYPNIGQFDIGGPVNAQGIPTQLQVIGDGFSPITLIDALHITGATGSTVLNFQTPPLPLGVLASFQAVFATTNGFFFAMSNAIELTII